MHRVIIPSEYDELLYKVQNLLKKPGEKPLTYSEAVIRSLELVLEVAKKNVFMDISERWSHVPNCKRDEKS